MENAEHDPGDVFAIPDLWGRPPALISDQESFLFSSIHLEDAQFCAPLTKLAAHDVASPCAAHDLTEYQRHDGFFAIPDFVAAPDPPPESRCSSPTQPTVTDAEFCDDASDVWLQDEGARDEPVYQSWDSFDDANHDEQTFYLTEAGAEVFDAALSIGTVFNVNEKDSLLVATGPFVASLHALGLGRASVFFMWRDDQESFQPMHPHVRISGCTSDAVNQVMSTFMACGNATRRLQQFVNTTYSGESSRALVALADAVASILAALQSRLAMPTRSIRSVLQAQELFRPVVEVLVCLERFTSSLAATTDEELLSRLFDRTQDAEHESEVLKELLLSILRHISQPWREFAAEWLGLQGESGIPVDQTASGKCFVKVELKTWIDTQGVEKKDSELVLDETALPSFMASDQSFSMFETGRSLRFLRAHHPDHPLSKPNVIEAAHPPQIDWAYSWSEIEAVQRRAARYEADLIAAIKTHADVSTTLAPCDTYHLDCFGRTADEIEAHLLGSIKEIEQPVTVADNSAFDATVEKLFHTSQLQDDAVLDPPVSLCASLSFGPIIAAQARVVNSVCMQLFFQSHHLRQHLSLQRDFQLLGNGMFSSRLSHALFDPDMETAERQKGIARSGGIMGLRLGSRDTWPPASSELRLALMGVLTESYVSPIANDRDHAGSYLDRTNDLPGDLSFSVREMSHEEIDQCLDVNSLAALDFLRLSYRPPSPLEAVITPTCLFKYDQIFRLLLRQLRMLFVVNQLSRQRAPAADQHEYRRFSYEAHNFVSSIARYFFDTGIDSTWRIFDRKLDQVEALMARGESGAFGEQASLDRLRAYHEAVLDRIMFSLLLRKRQRPVLQLLEEIFGIILRLATHVRHGTSGQTRNLYQAFRSKVGVFITVCRGLGEKRGYGERKGDAPVVTGGGIFDLEELKEANTISHLLVQLDLGEYYSKH